MRKRNLVAAAVLFCIPAFAQDKVCHKWDMRRVHEVHVTCNIQPKLDRKHAFIRNVGHDLKIAAEVVGSIVIFGAVVFLSAPSSNPSGEQ